MTKLTTMIIVGLVGLYIQGGAVLAANSDNGPGCGLGKLAWSDYKHQKNIAPQVMMATTNGTFGSQTFGISFGTSGCTNDGTVMAEKKTDVFVATMFESLAQDMAQGQGEHLTALATLIGVPAEHRATFFAMTQEQYAEVVQAGDTSSAAMLKAVQTAMQSHPLLATRMAKQ